MKRRYFLRSGAAIVGAAGLGGSFPAEAIAARAVRGAGRAADPVRLSSNENPLGLSPRAWDAVVNARDVMNRYPFQQQQAFMTLLADYVGVEPENLVLGAGSTEILQMAAQAYASPRAPLVLADPTFEDISDYQETEVYRRIPVPLDSRRAHDIGRMKEVIAKEGRPAMVYICNPNNPTATLTPSAEVDAWIAEAPESVMFVIDEAYYEYADDPSYWSAQKWIADRPNVIVARTFSKIFGMAGLRLGYAVAHPITIERLRAFQSQNNANQAALAAAVGSLEDPQLIPRAIAVNDESKAIAHRTLDELGLEYLPTQANFIMHRISGEVRPYIQRMADAGVLVGRPFPPMLQWNRVSFGTPEEMGVWADAIRGLRTMGHI